MTKFLAVCSTFWEHHALPFAQHSITIKVNCLIYMISKIAIFSKAFLASLIQGYKFISYNSLICIYIQYISWSIPNSAKNKHLNAKNVVLDFVSK